LQAEE
jgi:hypothetical protein